MPPLSLYLHLPWCVQKCPYCDFNSFTAGADAPKQRYLNALTLDISRWSDAAKGRSVDTVFLGGGTPSFFSPEEIGEALDAVRGALDLAPDAEITMEANPGTVECGDPSGYRAAGVNRLSLGAQSFDDAMLRRLGRIHSTDDIRRAFEGAREAGFDNINIDIMHTLPEQDVDGALADLEAAVRLEPEHISWYQLTLEPNTIFHARPPSGLPDDKLAADIYREGRALLDRNGYGQYEISAYAKQGKSCRHNLNYWRFGDYLPCGAGAHGKLTASDGPQRFVQPANPQAYMRAIESGERPTAEAVANSDRVFEFMLMALRLSEGFTAEQFEQTTRLTRGELESALEAPIAEGLMESVDGARFRPTDLGFRFLNDLQARFLPEAVE